MDLDLVEQAQRGDREAFAGLARQHGDALFALAHRILRDSDLAEDALQQALVLIWRDLPRLRDPERFEAWMRRILVRACYAEAARARRWTTNVRSLSFEPAVLTAGELSIDDRDQLERGFRRLTAEQQSILAMHHYLGMSIGEIASTLDVPLGTVKSRLHYAHKAMRAALDAVERGVAVAGGSIR